MDKNRRERIRIRKKRKITQEEAAEATQFASLKSTTPPAAGVPSASSQATQPSDMDEDEGTLRETERTLLHSLVDHHLIKDVGANVTGQD